MDLYELIERMAEGVDLNQFLGNIRTKEIPTSVGEMGIVRFSVCNLNGWQL